MEPRSHVDDESAIVSSSRGEFGPETFSSSPFSSPPDGGRETHMVSCDGNVDTGVGNGLAVTGICTDQVVRPTSATSGAAGSSTRDNSGAGRYRECLRNHAASVGGHVVDGCGEFMSGNEGDALKCSVCGCHRSFHRKEIEGSSNFATVAAPYYHYHLAAAAASNDGGRRNGMLSSSPQPPLLALPPPLSRQTHPYNPSPVTAFVGRTGRGGGVSTTESSSEEMDANTRMLAKTPIYPVNIPAPPSVLSRKRFRTKFSAEQKKKMLGFAEAVGWRMHRKDEVAMETFCAEVGVSRQVFKVWMHNNKHVSSSSSRKQNDQQQQQQQQQRQQPIPQTQQETEVEVRDEGRL